MSFPKLNQGATSNIAGSLGKIVTIIETGREINGQANVSNVNVYELVMNHSSQDGFFYAPGTQITGHSRMTLGFVVKMSGNSSSGSGKKQVFVGEGKWGTTTTNGRTSSWGSQGNGGSWLPPENVPWSGGGGAASGPPGGGNVASAPPPQPIADDVLAQMDARYKRDRQIEANGGTPPPLTAGSAPIYGSDGNRTAQEAMVEAGQMIQGMSQMAILPLKFLPGIGQVAVLAGSFMDLMQGNYLDAALGVSSVLNPCGMLTKGLAAISLANNISDMIENGATPGNVAGSLFDLLSIFGACFTGEMLVDVEGGKKRADQIEVGDKLWSRSEFEPDGPLMLKEVEERFVRVSPVLNLHVAGQVLRTTGEHPFWVENRRCWLPARELVVGDLLRTRCGSLVAVESVEDSGHVETVYNWRIADYHTYYVSATEDGASVWAHNAYNPGRAGKQSRLRQLASNLSLPRSIRGWFQQELNQIARGKRTTIRLPGSSKIRTINGQQYGGPGGMVLAHRRGYEARRGFGYMFADLQDSMLHLLQHQYEGYR